MKLLIIDIETTGFVPQGNSIVEIGLVLCDSDTRETIPVFNQIVRDGEFDYEKHKNSWIFKNTDLTPEEVRSAKHIDEYREELQKLFDVYPLTAYNKKFDLSFMRARGFVINDTKDLMKTATDISHELTGNPKWPSVEKIFALLFPDETYVEMHRGLNDALDEARLLYKFCDIKANKKLLTENK